MTPEQRVEQIEVELSRSGYWEGWTLDEYRAVAKAIRAAENEALDRAAGLARETGLDLTARRIEGLKTPETP